jgi:hypothetical protein
MTCICPFNDNKKLFVSLKREKQSHFSSNQCHPYFSVDFSFWEIHFLAPMDRYALYRKSLFWNLQILAEEKFTDFSATSKVS